MLDIKAVVVMNKSIAIMMRDRGEVCLSVDFWSEYAQAVCDAFGYSEAMYADYTTSTNGLKLLSEGYANQNILRAYHPSINNVTSVYGDATSVYILCDTIFKDIAKWIGRRLSVSYTELNNYQDLYNQFVGKNDSDIIALLLVIPTLDVENPDCIGMSLPIMITKAQPIDRVFGYLEYPNAQAFPSRVVKRRNPLDQLGV